MAIATNLHVPINVYSNLIMSYYTKIALENANLTTG